jgi:hypothetical protein
LFFSRKEPKALALRGFDEWIAKRANAFCFLFWKKKNITGRIKRGVTSFVILFFLKKEMRGSDEWIVSSAKQS